MTYNIRMPQQAESEGRDLSVAIATIKSANPDIIGLQEDDEGLEVYVSALDDSYYRLSGNSNGSEYLDIYYKKDKFSLYNNQTGTVYYKDLAKTFTNVDANGAKISDDHAGTESGFINKTYAGRFLRYAVLQSKDGVRILVVNTHLHYRKDSNGPTDADKLLRVYQAKLLCAWLESMETDYPNQIVLGDLNHTPSKLDSTFNDGGLTHARDTALVKGDVGATLVLQSTYADRDHDYVYDYILYKNVRAVAYTVIANKNDADGTRYPSDHLPVISEFICYAE